MTATTYFTVVGTVACAALVFRTVIAFKEFRRHNLEGESRAHD